MREEIIEILKTIRPDIDYKNDKNLVSDGIFDSFDMVLLLAALSERYSIEIDSDDITEQNFDNVEEMANLVKKYVDKK